MQVLIADAQQVTRIGLAQLLAGQYQVHEAETPEQAERLLAQHQPQVLLIDYLFPGFMVADLQRLRQAAPQVRVLAISSDSDEQRILKMLESGVSGYLTKHCKAEEIRLAVQTVSRGEKFFCNKVLDLILKKHVTKDEEDCEPTILTERELEVTGYIAQGLTNKEIAQELHLSPHTVHSHRKNVMRKLKAKSASDIILYAVQIGLIKPGN